MEIICYRSATAHYQKGKKQSETRLDELMIVSQDHVSESDNVLHALQ